MKRPGKIEDILSRLKDLKKKIPQMNLRTTVIIGFPGETEEDFKKTIEAVKAVEFSEVQLNKYEDRPGTVSSMMKDKIPKEIIDRRYNEIKKYC
jgi:tRNA A37 methylthiotransferase MiaB